MLRTCTKQSRSLLRRVQQHHQHSSQQQWQPAIVAMGGLMDGISSGSSSSSSSSNQSNINSLIQQTQRQWYVSRAHPKVADEFPVQEAMEMVLDGIEERKAKRAAKWEQNAAKRQAKGIVETSGPFRNQDETVELAINLNVDPRRPGQALRGSLKLPAGTGKQVSCLVFTKDPKIIEQISSASGGSTLAGGEELMDQIIDGTVAMDSYQRALCTKDILPQLQKSCARLLGPRGLMPNLKTNTVFETGDQLLETLEEQSAMVTYRTEANGILHFAIGKGSFTPEQLLSNVEAICQTVQNIKPEHYGKGKKLKKKMGKNVKYWLKAHLSSTQGKGVRMDLRTIDPTSPFFMRDPE